MNNQFIRKMIKMFVIVSFFYREILFIGNNL